MGGRFDGAWRAGGNSLPLPVRQGLAANTNVQTAAEAGTGNFCRARLAGETA